MARRAPGTVHVIPVDDLIEHQKAGDECACGPTVEAVFRDDGSNNWLIVHNSLDGRESREAVQPNPHKEGRPTMTQQPYDANSILMGGGSFPPPWKFDEPGTTHTGTITAPPTARQERDYDPDNPGGGALKVFPSGDPIMGVVVELQTDERTVLIDNDDGRRTFYCEGRYLKEATRNAVRKAGATGLEKGGQLKVTFTHRERPMDTTSRKYWEVVYTPAGNVALMDDQPPLGGYPNMPTSVQTTGPAEFAPTTPTTVGAPPTVTQMSPEQIAAFSAWQQSQNAQR